MKLVRGQATVSGCYDRISCATLRWASSVTGGSEEGLHLFQILALGINVESWKSLSSGLAMAIAVGK
jgi:hypothetical protein